MNKLLFVVTTLLLSFLSHAATITAAQDPWAPFVQQNNANPGISVEIVIEAFKTQGHDVDFKIMPWTRALNEVKDGRVDVLVATWFTQETHLIPQLQSALSGKFTQVYQMQW